MNTGLIAYQKQRFIEEEWADISGFGDEAVSLAREFMESRGYVSILDLTDEDLIDYRVWAADVFKAASSNRHPALHIFETLYLV